MDIRCVNCGLEFAFDPPPFSQQQEAACPRCGHGNAVEAEAGSGGMGAYGGDEEVFCFNCGKPMQARADELIPVCDECKVGAESDAGAAGARTEDLPDEGPPSAEAELMVRKSNGQVYGPFPEETIIEWIKAGKIHRDEEVSKIGGAWRSFNKHEQFSSYFPEVKVVSRTESQDVQFKKVSRAKEGATALVRLLVAVIFLAVVGGGVYWLAKRGTLALPDSVIGKASDVIAGNGEEVTEAVDEGSVGELIDELRAKHAGVEGSSFEHYYRGRTLMARGNPDDLLAARTEMEIAVVLDTSNAAALAGVGEVYNRISVFDKASGDLQRRSFYFIDSAMEKGEYMLEAWRAKAWFLYVNDKHEEAIGYCEKALGVNDQDVESHMLLGMASFGKFRSMDGRVLTHFDRALEIAPSFGEVHYQKGRCYEQMGRHRDAIDAYTAKIQSDPAFIGSHFSLGHLYESVGDFDKAVASYEQVLQLSPKHKQAILRVGPIYTQIHRDSARAATLYERLVGDDVPELSSGEQIDLALARASALRLQGDLDGACKAADRALALDDSSHVAWFEKSLCQWKKGLHDGALQSMGKASGYASRENLRTQAEIEFFRGVIQADDGQSQDADHAFSTALERDPSLIPAAVFHAGIWAALDKDDRAKSCMQPIKEVDPWAFRRSEGVQEMWAPVPDMTSSCKAIGGVLANVNHDPDLFGLAGAACYYANDTGRAGSYLSRSLQDDPRNWPGLLYTGLIAWESGNHGKAASMFEQLVNEHRDVAMFHVIYGDYLLSRKDLEGAQEQYVVALKYELDLAWAHNQLGMVKVQQGDQPGAREEFDKALEIDGGLFESRRNIFKYEL